jgi:hypothetical protein
LMRVKINKDAKISKSKQYNWGLFIL